MFSLTSLHCFLEAAKELNFTHAAKNLYISQQALSTHISKLEEYYGIRLFDRGIPLTLTDAGKALAQYAQDIFQSIDSCGKEIQEIKNFRQGELTVAIPVTRGTVMLPPLLSAFHREFPQIHLNLMEGTASWNAIDALYAGTADLYIGYQPEHTNDLVVTPLYPEKFVILVPNSLLKEYFPGRKQEQLWSKALPIERFAQLPFVAQTPDTMNGKVFRNLCRDANLEPNIIVSTQNLITEISLCTQGIGACVVPLVFLSPTQRMDGTIPLFDRESLNQLSVFALDIGELDYPIVICRLKSKLLTRAGQEFISLAREIYGGPANNQIPAQFQFDSGP